MFEGICRETHTRTTHKETLRLEVHEEKKAKNERNKTKQNKTNMKHKKAKAHIQAYIPQRNGRRARAGCENEKKHAQVLVRAGKRERQQNKSRNGHAKQKNTQKHVLTDEHDLVDGLRGVADWGNAKARAGR